MYKIKIKKYNKIEYLQNFEFFSKKLLPNALIYYIIKKS